MGQVISLLETGDAHAYDRASHQQHLRNNAGHQWAQQSWQQNYGRDQYMGGTPGTGGYAAPNMRQGTGTVTINQPADRRSTTQCAGAVAVGAGGGFVAGGLVGNASANAICNGIPPGPGKAVCRAGSSMVGAGTGAYHGGKEMYNSGFCNK